MLTFLGLIVAMIMIGIFWRVILPVALIGVACIVVVIGIGAGIITYQNSQANDKYVIVPVEGNPFTFKCPDPKNWDASYPDYNPSKELVDWQKKNCSWTPNH